MGLKNGCFWRVLYDRFKTASAARICRAARVPPPGKELQKVFCWPPGARRTLVSFFMPWGKQLEVPHRLRAIVRARESSIIVLALLAGALAGLVIAGMGGLVALVHFKIG